MITKLKAGESLTKDWVTINKMIDALDAAERRLARLEHPNDRRYQILGDNAPFQIQRASTWLKFKVSTGKVITGGDPITATNIDTEITITSGVARYWFYMEMTSTTATVMTSATTLVWSATKIPIGWVDTLTGVATTTSIINQFLNENIFNPCVT